MLRDGREVKPRDIESAKMRILLQYQKSLAIGLLGSSHHFEGHNLVAQLSLYCDSGEGGAEACGALVQQVLGTIDHAHLGRDQQLMAEPTLANVCLWIVREIESRSSSAGAGAGAKVQLHECLLQQGDGQLVRYFGQPKPAVPPVFVKG